MPHEASFNSKRKGLSIHWSSLVQLPNNTQGDLGQEKTLQMAQSLIHVLALRHSSSRKRYTVKCLYRVQGNSNRKTGVCVQRTLKQGYVLVNTVIILSRHGAWCTYKCQQMPDYEVTSNQVSWAGHQELAVIWAMKPLSWMYPALKHCQALASWGLCYR